MMTREKLNPFSFESQMAYAIHDWLLRIDPDYHKLIGRAYENQFNIADALGEFNPDEQLQLDRARLKQLKSAFAQSEEEPISKQMLHDLGRELVEDFEIPVSDNTLDIAVYGLWSYLERNQPQFVNLGL